MVRISSHWYSSSASSILSTPSHCASLSSFSILSQQTGFRLKRPDRAGDRLSPSRAEAKDAYRNSSSSHKFIHDTLICHFNIIPSSTHKSSIQGFSCLSFLFAYFVVTMHATLLAHLPYNACYITHPSPLPCMLHYLPIPFTLLRSYVRCRLPSLHARIPFTSSKFDLHI